MLSRTAIRLAAAAAVALVSAAWWTYAAEEPDIRKEMKQRVDESATSTKASIDDLRAVRFTVKKVDRANHTVTLEAKVSPEASFQSGQGAPMKIDSLREGDEVRAAFNPDTGEVIAVQVLPAAERTAPEPAKKASEAEPKK